MLQCLLIDRSLGYEAQTVAGSAHRQQSVTRLHAHLRRYYYPAVLIKSPPAKHADRATFESIGNLTHQFGHADAEPTGAPAARREDRFAPRLERWPILPANPAMKRSASGRPLRNSRYTASA